MNKNKKIFSILLCILIIIISQNNIFALEVINPSNDNYERPITIKIASTFDLIDRYGDSFNKYIVPESPYKIELICLDYNNFNDYIDSHSSEIDILFLENDFVEFETALKKWQPLEIKSNILNNRVDKMNNVLQAELTKDGHLYAYPFCIDSNYFAYNYELFDKSGLKYLPHTYDQYIDLMLEWYKMNKDKKPNHSFDGWTNILDEQLWTIKKFISTEFLIKTRGPFREPRFKSALEKLYKLNEFRNLDFSDANDRWIFNTHTIINPLDFDGNVMETNFRYLLPLRTEPWGNYVIDSDLYYFIINKDTKNYDAAVKLLEIIQQDKYAPTNYYEYSSEDNSSDLMNGYNNELEYYRFNMSMLNLQLSNMEKNVEFEPLLKDSTTFKKDYEEKKLELSNLEHEYEDIIRSKKDNISEYRRLQPYFRFKNHSHLFNMEREKDLNRILTDYFEGRVSIDETIKKLDISYFDFISEHEK